MGRSGALRRLHGGRLSQRRQIVQNPEAPAVGSRNQIGTETGAVVLDLEVAHRNRRHVVAQRLPVIAVIKRHPDLGIGRSVEQPLLPGIFADRVGHRARSDAGVDLGPALAAIVGAPEVRIHVVDPHRVRRGVGGQRVEVAGVQIEDPGPRLDRRRGHIGPGGAPIGGNLDIAVVGPRPDHVDVARRERKRRDRAERRRGHRRGVFPRVRRRRPASAGPGRD